SVDPVERGHHVARCTVEPDQAAAVLLDRAAEEAAARGDHAGAAAFLLRAVEVSVDPLGDRASLLGARAAVELVLAGDVGAAGSLARDLVARLPKGVARAQARQSLVACTFGSEMSYSDALSELGLAVEDAEDDVEQQAELELELTHVCLGTLRLEDAVAHARRTIELADAAGAGTTAVCALGFLGMAECMLGRGVTAAARAAHARWDGNVVAVNSYSPRMALAFVCLHSLEFEEAATLFEQELVWAAERGLEAVEVVARVHLAQVQLRVGRWSEAHANA